MERPLVKNSSSKRQIRGAAKRERLNRIEELNQIRTIAALPRQVGLKFLWRYLTGCGVFRSTFTGRSDTFFLEGQRFIGLQLLEDINDADPRIYVAMINLRKDEEETDAGRSKRSGARPADGEPNTELDEPGGSDWDYDPS